MLGKTTYTSMYSSTWSNRVRSGDYLGRLLVTYSSPSLSLNPLDSLIFLLDFTGPCLMWHFAMVWIRTLGQGAVKGGLITPLFQEVFNSFCSSVNYSSLREVQYKSRGRWYSSISRTTSKLL